MDTTTTDNYYNAKPSKISNIGSDLANSKRHNFNTYETDAKKTERLKVKNTTKELKNTRTSIIAELTSDTPNILKVNKLIQLEFSLKHDIDFLTCSDFLKAERLELRDLNIKRSEKLLSEIEKIDLNTRIDDFNILLKSFNKIKPFATENYYSEADYTLRKLRYKYLPKTKETFKEDSGIFSSWKDGASNELGSRSDISELTNKVKAVQFGNSVPDSERAYICNNLNKFLETWSGTFPNINLSELGFSFGSRGRANSVAFFEPASKIVSTNRNYIGALIHEIGHYLDYKSNKLSAKITYKTINEYDDQILLKNKVDRRTRQYYLKRVEIFARAFEQYCYELIELNKANFVCFELCGQKTLLPALNDNLREVIAEVLTVTTKE